MASWRAFQQDELDEAGRRAPFANSPVVGVRGLRTRQRILDAALAVFGEHGFDRSTFDQVAAGAGCSRVSIYQYFSDKHDLFRHLANQVVRQIRAATEALDEVTPDRDGVDALASWIDRCDEVHSRYEAVFRAFSAAAVSDASLVEGAGVVSERHVGTVSGRVSRCDLPPRQFDPMLALLVRGIGAALDLSVMLRAASPGIDRGRLIDGLAQAAHRVLFGPIPGVNSGGATGNPLPALTWSPELVAMFGRARDLERDAAAPGRRALAAMLEVGGDVVVARGHLGVRVSDVIEAAAVSHGAFYRYFTNIEDFVDAVSILAIRELSGSFANLPALDDRGALRRWLRDYDALNAANGAVIRIWAEAASAPLRDGRATVYDWGRRRLVRLLDGQSPGDVEADSVLLLALVEAFATEVDAPPDVETAVRVIERGFVANPNGRTS